MTNALTALAGRGVCVWLDDLDRDRLTSGSLARLVTHDHVVGLTTDPTIDRGDERFPRRGWSRHTRAPESRGQVIHVVSFQPGTGGGFTRMHVD